jgi:tRNA modification GTPase
MDWDLEETIVAPASAPGGAARSIVRASGGLVPKLLADCFRPTDHHGTTPFLAAARQVPHALSGSFLARDPLGEIPCQVLVWPTTRSYTRQLAAEFHLPGSPPILAAVIESLCHAGARLAGPGEFTLRAFLAGRLDLTQAEAVLGVIESASSRELAVALEQLGGGLAGPLDALRNRLLDLLAHLEAGLDFVEEDIEFLSRDDLVEQLQNAEVEVRELVDRLPRRSQGRSELRVVLRGLPNSGKSSLLNALVGEERALVSDEAGTTRDYIQGVVDLEGVVVGLIDTAGVDESADRGIAGLAQQSTRQQHEQAHLELFCLDASRPCSDWELAELAAEPPCPRLIVLTKQDLMCEEVAPLSFPAVESGAFTRGRGMELADGAIPTSSRTGFGLEALRQAIRNILGEAGGVQGEVVQGTASRCHDSLERAFEGLVLAGVLAQDDQGDELIAAELRLALDELGRVVGAVYTEDVLDRIFSRFCIGK